MIQNVHRKNCIGRIISLILNSRAARDELDDDGIQREQIQEIENELDQLKDEREQIEEMEQVEKQLNKDGIKGHVTFEI